LRETCNSRKRRTIWKIKRGEEKVTKRTSKKRNPPRPQLKKKTGGGGPLGKAGEGQEGGGGKGDFNVGGKKTWVCDSRALQLKQKRQHTRGEGPTGRTKGKWCHAKLRKK